MADIVQSTAETAGFIPQYWAQRALEVLRAQIVLPQVVARDTNFGETGWEGKSITVPYPGEFTAVRKVEGTPATPAAPVNGTSVTLTLNNHFGVFMLVEDFANALATGNLMDRYIGPAAIAIAEKFQTDLFSTLAAAGTIAPIGTAATDLTAATMRTAMADLDTAKAPLENRSLIMSPKDKAAILGDSTLATYFAFSQADAIRNGYFGELYGMNLYWSQQVPTGQSVTAVSSASTFTYSGQTTASLTWSSLTAAALQAAIQALSSVGAAGINASVSGPTGGPFILSLSNGGVVTASSATLAAAHSAVALHKNAVMFACRPFENVDPSEGVSIAQVNDAESGLSIRIAKQYDINNLGTRINLDILYGMQVLRPTQAIQILT